MCKRKGLREIKCVYMNEKETKGEKTRKKKKATMKNRVKNSRKNEKKKHT